MPGAYASGDHFSPLSGAALTSSSPVRSSSGVPTPTVPVKVKRASAKKAAAPLAPIPPEHWIFDEKSVPQDVSRWVLAWFSRQECCVLRAVCKKWCDIVGLRVYTQQTFMEEGNSVLRIPPSRFLGSRPSPWHKSKMADRITALNIGSTPLGGTNFLESTYLDEVPILNPFKNLKHLAVRGLSNILHLIWGAGLSLDSLTIYSRFSDSPMPSATPSQTFHLKRLQLSDYNNVSVLQLQALLSVFPDLEHLALIKVGLDMPRRTVNWIASKYGDTLSTLLIDLVPYTTTKREEVITLVELQPLFAMRQLKVLTVYGNDNSPPQERKSMEKREMDPIVYSSPTLECLALESPNGTRSPIKLDLPNLAELTCGNMLYVDASDCPLLETLLFDGPMEHASLFFRLCKASQLRNLRLISSALPLSKSKCDLKLVLPELVTFKFNVGHDEISSFSLSAPKLETLDLSTKHFPTPLKLDVPNVTSVTANGCPKVLLQLELLLHPHWSMLRHIHLHQHHSHDSMLMGGGALDAASTEMQRVTDAERNTVPRSHAMVTTMNTETEIRDPLMFSHFPMLTNLNVATKIDDLNLRYILGAAKELPNLMFLNITSSSSSAEPPRRLAVMDPFSDAPMPVMLPSLVALTLALHAVPQLKFPVGSACNRHLSSLRILHRPQYEWGAPTSKTIMKIDWIKNLHGLLDLTLLGLKLPTSLHIQSNSLRSLQLIDTTTHQQTKMVLDCPQLRVLNIKDPQKIRSIEAKLPNLEKAHLTSDVRHLLDDLYAAAPPTRPKQMEVTEAEFVRRSIRAGGRMGGGGMGAAVWNRAGRGGIFGGGAQFDGILAALFGPIALLRHQFLFNVDGDDEDDEEDRDSDSEEDSDDAVFLGQPCPHCGRYHNRDPYGMAHPYDDDSDSDDDSEDEDE